MHMTSLGANDHETDANANTLRRRSLRRSTQEAGDKSGSPRMAWRFENQLIKLP